MCFEILVNFFSLCFETSDACYHVSSESVTPPEAEVSCGILGGRLASFVTSQELADLRNNLMYYVYPTEFWIGMKLVLIVLKLSFELLFLLIYLIVKIVNSLKMAFSKGEKYCKKIYINKSKYSVLGAVSFQYFIIKIHSQYTRQKNNSVFSQVC